MISRSKKPLVVLIPCFEQLLILVYHFDTLRTNSTPFTYGLRMEKNLDRVSVNDQVFVSVNCVLHWTSPFTKLAKLWLSVMLYFYYFFLLGFAYHTFSATLKTEFGVKQFLISNPLCQTGFTVALSLPAFT